MSTDENMYIVWIVNQQYIILQKLYCEGNVAIEQSLQNPGPWISQSC